MAKYAYRKGVWEKLMKEEEGIQEARRLVGHKESWGETLKRTSVYSEHLRILLEKGSYRQYVDDKKILIELVPSKFQNRL